MKFFLSLFKKGAVVKPVTKNDKDSQWLCMWATPLADLLDDWKRYGFIVMLWNFRRLKELSK